ncbi:MAG: SET domain-containing protein-lysine N-methyltransferase [Nitrosopumilales archaeon]|nr:MAG: SET domain-containing protein-lysine N-methyltransferase [Nitrosopumilales archaeon]
MKRFGDPVFWHDYSETPHLKGVSVMQFISTSNIVIHALDLLKTVFINIFSCKDFDYESAYAYTKKYFDSQDSSYTSVKRKTNSYDNPKVELMNHTDFGKGVFAKEKIFLGEIIAVYDGEIYSAEKASDLPNDPPNNFRDHLVQFAPNKYRDSNGLARYINHSCNPNCGIKDKFKIVAMRDIDQNEEITWDYDMTENSDWTMICKCNSKNCRKIIKGFRYLPKEKLQEYKGYISDYLID